MYGKIVTQMVDMCRKNGSDPINLRVSLGPHIRACSYSVPEERAEQFEKCMVKTPVSCPYLIRNIFSICQRQYFWISFKAE